MACVPHSIDPEDDPRSQHHPHPDHSHSEPRFFDRVYAEVRADIDDIFRAPRTGSTAIHFSSASRDSGLRFSPQRPREPAVRDAQE